MSDDVWGEDSTDDPPKRQFGDDWDLDRLPADGARPRAVKPVASADEPSGVGGFDDFGDDLPPLRFGDDTSGLPHWNDPPTGEVPSLFTEPDASADLDVWSGFSSPSAPSGGMPAPQWAVDPDDTRVERSPVTESAPLIGDDSTGIVTAPRPVRGSVQIGTDPTNDPSSGIPRDRAKAERAADRPSSRAGNGVNSTGRAAPATGGGRNMPIAVATGLGLAALFIVLLRFGSVAVLGLIMAVLGLAAIEFYEETKERGYRPVAVAGVPACFLMPLAAYLRGVDGLLIVIVAAFVAATVSAMTYDGVESGPLPNTAITMLGVMWIGVLGSFAALILEKGEDLKAAVPNVGTDTLFYLAVGVVASDVGALAIGSFLGRTPLRRWISPNKTVEGLIGGIIMTVGALLVVRTLNDTAGTWNSVSEVVILAIVVALMAPIGDLVESMFKRNLDIKDFGTLMPGHGGVLDRFDGFLMVLPGAYYLLTTLEPFLP